MEEEILIKIRLLILYNAKAFSNNNVPKIMKDKNRLKIIY